MPSQPLRAALLLLLSLFGSAAAYGGMTFTLDSLSANGLRLEGIGLTLQESEDGKQPLQLRIAKIALPPPFDVLSFLELQCPGFTYNDAGLSCTGGQAKIVSPWLDADTVPVDFQFSAQSSTLHLRRAKFAGGTLQLAFEQSQKQWRANLTATGLRAKSLQRLLPKNSLTIAAGKIDFRAEAEAHDGDVTHITANLAIRELDAQSADGTYATEKLYADLRLNGKIASDNWQWQQRLRISRGGLYGDPIYIAAGEHPLELQGNGQWLLQTGQLRFDDMRLTHANVAQASGQAIFQNGAVQQANLTVQSEQLDKFSSIYLRPFIVASGWENLELSGRLAAQIKLHGKQITHLDVDLPQFGITDDLKRIALYHGKAGLHWAREKGSGSVRLGWKRLNLYALPFDKTALMFGIYGKSLRLAKSADLPLLGGMLHVSRFDWLAGAEAQPEINFQGNIEQVPLDKLSDALHWPPLSGQLSGTIPGVHYRNGLLKIDGALEMRVFDGLITLRDMRLSDLSGSAPNLNADLDIDNLDLQQITGRFAFGSMQGRLSGFVRDLQLENWQPVSFFAWLGTPDGDNSTHRISQKAVNSIASIGGGGAADLLSRSMLRAFDNFGYDRLGIGCYLYRGVCQLFGVEAARQGFYIVKGGGLPRIDVIGYNSRIDWQTLLLRLQRILTTDKAVIQ